MSVDYRSILVRGWKISAKEFMQMNDASNWEFEGNFYIADCYRDDPEYVFGQMIKAVDCEGVIKEINPEEIKNLSRFEYMPYWLDMLRKCGRSDLTVVEPKAYFIGQVY